MPFSNMWHLESIEERDAREGSVIYLHDLATRSQDMVMRSWLGPLMSPAALSVWLIFRYDGSGASTL